MKVLVSRLSAEFDHGSAIELMRVISLRGGIEALDALLTKVESRNHLQRTSAILRIHQLKGLDLRDALTRVFWRHGRKQQVLGVIPSIPDPNAAYV